MNRVEDLSDLPPFYEGGPQSEQLLPEFRTDLELDSYIDQVTALIQRQTGLDLSSDRIFRFEPALPNTKPYINSVPSEPYTDYSQRKGAEESMLRGEPLAQSGDCTVKAVIRRVYNEGDLPWMRTHDYPINLPFTDIVGMEASLNSHSLQIVKISQEGLILHYAKVVGDDEKKGGVLVAYHKTPKGGDWSVDLAQNPGDPEVKLSVRKDNQPIEHQKNGWFGQKIPKQELVNGIIGDTIDKLPRKGILIPNSRYYSYPDSRYGYA
jgi:hypothetical protein